MQEALKKRAAEIDAERDAWMAQKDEERERAEEARRKAADADDWTVDDAVDDGAGGAYADGAEVSEGVGDGGASADGRAAGSDPSRVDRDDPLEWLAAEHKQMSEFEAHKQNDLIERQRRELGRLGPGPSDGDVGRGCTSDPNGFERPRRERRFSDREPVDPFPPETADSVQWRDADRVRRDGGGIALPCDSDAVPRKEKASNADDTETDFQTKPRPGGPDLADCMAPTQHPLLSEEAWTDLGKMAPEMTGSIESLRTLVDELECFSRPMGPDEAVTMLDGIETLNRLTEALSVVTLSVFERVGTPRDYGAKSTRDLVKNRLGVNHAEASRRVDLAEQLGRRVSFSGESLEPDNPVVADALRTGTLSSVQARTITQCLDKLPRTTTSEQRLEAERILVEKAPLVHVRDIRVLFAEILKWLDPDGELPDDSTPREDFSVNLRARKDGTWDLRGRLDSVTGGIMHGLLTSRMQTDDDVPADGDVKSDATVPTGAPSNDDHLAEADAPGAASVQQADGTVTVEASPNGSSPDDDTSLSGDPATAHGTAGTTDASAAMNDAMNEAVRLFEDVLHGDRYDAIDPTPRLESERNGRVDANGVEVPAGYGVHADGTPVPMSSDQPSVRNRIYERFSTIIGHIEMNRVGAGAPFALVVTAKAEDIARGAGEATTGAAEPFPIATASRDGLNGAVFFHLMSEKRRTVSVQTENRYANRNQLTILAARDQGCTFPGCETPPGWCDAHHIVPWANEGKTEINNLTLACSAHHHLIDKTDWHTIMLKDGRPAWVPPATIDPAREPILHSRFIAGEIADTLFD